MVRVRDDCSATELRRLAKAARTTAASRRMLSLALLLEGAKRAEAASAGGMDRQTLRDWVHRFNADGPEGLYSKQGPGPSCRLSEAQRQELAAIIEAGPDLAEHGWSAFGSVISARWWRSVLASPTGSKVIPSSSRSWVSAGTGRSIPKAIPRSRPSTKKIPGSGRECRRRQSRWMPDRNLVRR